MPRRFGFEKIGNSHRRRRCSGLNAVIRAVAKVADAEGVQFTVSETVRGLIREIIYS